MKADPDAERPAGRPGFGGHLALDRDGGDDRLAGERKHREERVALGIHLDSATRPEFRADDRPVSLKDLRVPVAEALEETGGALDVAEEERQGAAGEVAHRRQVSVRRANAANEAARHVRRARVPGLLRRWVTAAPDE